MLLLLKFIQKTRDLGWGAGMRHEWDYGVMFWYGDGDKAPLVELTMVLSIF